MYTLEPDDGTASLLLDVDGRGFRAAWSEAGDELVISVRPVSKDADHRHLRFSEEGALRADERLLYVETVDARYSSSALYGWHPFEDCVLYKKADAGCGGNPVWRRYFDGREELYLDPAVVDDGIVYTLDFHPSGTEVLWTSQVGCWSPTLAIHRADVVDGEIDFGTIEGLLDNGRYVAPARYSPDGTRVAFRQSDAGQDYGGPENLYVMNADGTNVTRLTDNTRSDERLTSFAWSPDGRRLAFAQSRTWSHDRNTDLFVVDVETMIETQLTRTPEREEVLEWR